MKQQDQCIRNHQQIDKLKIATSSICQQGTVDLVVIFGLLTYIGKKKCNKKIKLTLSLTLLLTLTLTLQSTKKKKGTEIS